MKLETTEKGHIRLTEVYNGVELKTRDGETLSICMRDTGFEFTYEGVLYFAQQGELKPAKLSSRGNVLVDQSDKDDCINQGS